MKNLYVNGCSFTAGHDVEEEKTWPYLLSKKLNLKLFKHAKNGQSFDSIFLNTINHLSVLDPKDTLVVIGTTYPTRYSIPFDEITANVTPVDIVGKNEHKSVKSNFGDKIKLERRIASPYILDRAELKELYYEFYPNGDTDKPTEKKIRFDKLMKSFVNYYEHKVELDNNLFNNEHIHLMSLVVALQGFLEKNNFEYRFVDFFNILRLKEENVNLWSHPINKMFDLENVVYFGGKWREKYVKGHPTQEGCYNISEVLYDSINR